MILGEVVVCVALCACEGETPPPKRSQDIQETRPMNSRAELCSFTGNVPKDANRCRSTGGEGDERSTRVCQPKRKFI
jgi:hypothetical protein